MNAWSRVNQRLIDQRGEALPPTWCPRAPDGEGAPLASSGVMRTDPGRHVASALCAAIAGAQEVVVAASFLLADEEIQRALGQAAKKGVRVYLVLATETRLEKDLPEDSEFEQRALADHKRMLGSLAGWALVRSAPTFHAKVVLVDPALGGRGFLLTANLTLEALTRNEELAVELTSAESRIVFEHLRWAMWEAAEHEILEPGRLSAVSGPLKQVPRSGPRSGIVATLGEPGAIRAAALDLARAARRAITVASFGWDADHEVVQALCARAREGLPVTVLARIRPASMPALLALAQAGARVLGYRWLHAKAIAIDEGAALVMSANLQRHGLDSGFELGVVLQDARAAALRDILRGWTASAPYELRLAPLLGEVMGAAEVWLDRKLVPYVITTSAPVGADSVIAASADRLESEPRAPRRKGELPRPAHTLALTWTVEAPRLAPGAKEIKGTLEKSAAPGDPRVFRERDGRIVIAVRTLDDLPRARELATQLEAATIVVRESGDERAGAATR
jgi:cardiolipin synthase